MTSPELHLCEAAGIDAPAYCSHMSCAVYCVYCNTCRNTALDNAAVSPATHLSQLLPSSVGTLADYSVTLPLWCCYINPESTDVSRAPHNITQL